MNNTLQRSVRFYRLPGKSIVFTRNLKCGSTFYSNIFMANGWQENTWDQINWQNDHVFGLVMDPYVRHVKGMVQDAIGMGIEKIMLNYFGIELWHNIPWLGSHSMPMSIRYGAQINQIDWIPVDIDLVSVESIISNMVGVHGATVDWSIPVFRNESDQYKKDLFDQFSVLLNSRKKQDLLNIACQDYQIYNQSLATYGGK